MSKPVKRHLKVGTAPESDEDELLIRMHADDLPKGIKWNKYIHVFVQDSKISCRVRTNQVAEVQEPRIHQININRALREYLSIKSNKVYDFYLGKASRLKIPYYVLKYHPDRNKKRNMLLKMIGTSIFILAIIGGVLYYFLGYQ